MSKSEDKPHEQVAIVTGAASGIGRSIAVLLASGGAKTLVADIDEDNAEATVEMIVESGGDASSMRVDVSESDEVEAMISEAVSRYGRLDVLVNNAADLSLIPLDLSVTDTDVEILDRVYNTNLRSVYIACKAAIPHMLQNGGGAIVNISSIQSLMGDMERTAYSMMKAGMNSLSRSIATQYGKQGVRCNTVCPGPIMNRDPGKAWPDFVQDAYRSAVLTTDIGAPSDVGHLVALLASERGKFISGQTIPVDGGFSAHMHMHMSAED